MVSCMAKEPNMLWWVRPLLKTAGLLAILAVGLVTLRFLCLPIAIAYLCLSAWPPSRRNSAWPAGAFLVFVACAFQPLDVVGRGIHYNEAGRTGLRVVPYRSGLILGTPQDECFLGGCLRMPFEPKWILVWD